MKSKEIQALSLEIWLGPSSEKFSSDLETMDREWNIT